MRLRLLIDVLVNDHDIADLQEIVHDQPVTQINVLGTRFIWNGRFMGAAPVENTEE